MPKDKDSKVGIEEEKTHLNAVRERGERPKKLLCGETRTRGVKVSGDKEKVTCDKCLTEKEALRR